ncbi:GGDEF domain-containing protein [Lacticaseibacillus saniviri]
MNFKSQLAFRTDLYLLGILLIFAMTALFMGFFGGTALFQNALYLAVSLLLVLLTYFLGLTVGLIANWVFIFIQALIMVYQYVVLGKDLPMSMYFWLVLPIILSVVFYGFAQQTVALQDENTKLNQDLDQYGAFDQETNLRTPVAYLEDAAVFIETSRRYDLPVTTVVLQIRFFNDVQRLLNPNQLQNLIQAISQTLVASTRDNDIGYILDRQNPTWGVLLFTDTAGADIAADRIKANFELKMAELDLSNVAVDLVVGIATYDAQTMNSPQAFMNAAKKETEYDV